MAKYKVDISGVNTSELKVLKNDEIRELFIRLKNGDTSAKEELVNENLNNLELFKVVLKYLNSYKFYSII